MEIVFTARHYDLTNQLRDHISKKLEKLGNMVGNSSESAEARVVLTAQRHRHSAEVTLKARGHDFVATSEADEMNAAADQVVERLETQLRRYKDRQVKRRRGDGRSADSDIPDLTRTDRVMTRPMTVDDALEELAEHGGEYLVFMNTETSQMTMLYRRQDGTYGLIEPGA